MNKIITFLAKLGFWPFVILFTVITLILSELLVVIHSYWLTGGFFDTNMLITGFTIPILDGLVVYGLVACLIRYLHELEAEKSKTIALQKDAEEKLKKSESYQRAILDSFPFFVWLKDENGNYLATNKAVAKATGFENPSEIIGKNDFDLFPEEMANSFRADDAEIMQTLQKKELEELIEGHGERKWHATYKAPILDDEGNLFGTVGFAKDITQDKEFEEELKLMKHALDRVKEAVHLTKKDGTFIYANDGACRQLGYTKDELKTMQISDIDPNFPKSRISSHWNEVKKNGLVTVFTTHIKKDGTTFPVEVNANFVEYREDEYILAFVKDITERKIMEDKLKLAASVFTSTHEGILITDAGNNIIDVNEAFTTITGYTRDEVLGENPKILQSGRNDQKFYEEFWASLEKDGVWKGKLWNRKKNGEEYVENTTMSVVYNDNKEIQNYISIFTDVTREHRQRQELEHNAHYDSLTCLPNRVLFADRMKQAITQAVRKNQLISVAYIDIDGFKEINDTYGHEIGDKLLVMLAEKMTKNLREGDTISRVGGDEFISLFTDIPNEESVIPFIARLVEAIAEPESIEEFPINRLLA